MREEHAAHIKEVTKEMEKLAITKLGDASRRALEENTMLLRQVCSYNFHHIMWFPIFLFSPIKVAAVGGKLTLIESQLATARYQNQGLKALLQKTESKYADASKQLIAEKSVKRIIYFKLSNNFPHSAFRLHVQNSRNERRSWTWKLFFRGRSYNAKSRRRSSLSCKQKMQPSRKGSDMWNRNVQGNKKL